MGDGFVDSPRSRGESGHDSDGINIIPVLIRELEQVVAGRTPAQSSRQFAAGDVSLRQVERVGLHEPDQRTG